MSDNINISPGVGETVATDDVSGSQYQRIKITDGTADSSTHLKVGTVDAVAGLADTGLQILVVRNDVLAALGDTDGDYVPLQVDALGSLYVTAGASDALVEITPTLDTSAYTSGDVLFTATEIAGVSRSAGKSAILESVMVVDKDDQKLAFNIHLFDRTVTSGTINVAPTISDADGAFYMGTIKVVAGDYFDLGGVSVANPTITPKVVKPNATSLFAFAVAQGAPTHTASGLVLKFGFLRS